MEKKLLGVLVGLARATDGNEHFITPELTELIIEAMAATLPHVSSEDELNALYSRAVEAKKAIVPNCFLCDTPCGRTCDFDLNELNAAPAKVREEKMRMFSLAQSTAASGKEVDPSLLYDVLYLMGMDMDTPEYLMPMIQKLECI